MIHNIWYMSARQLLWLVFLWVHPLVLWPSKFDVNNHEKPSWCFTIEWTWRNCRWPFLYRGPIYDNGTSNTLKSPLTTELSTLGTKFGIRRQNSTRITLKLKKNFLVENGEHPTHTQKVSYVEVILFFESVDSFSSGCLRAQERH